MSWQSRFYDVKEDSIAAHILRLDLNISVVALVAVFLVFLIGTSQVLAGSPYRLLEIVILTRAVLLT